jgi:hypothetical protein
MVGSLQFTPTESDLFAVKFTAAGSISFEQYYTFAQADGSMGNAIALDSTGANAYVAGSILPHGGDNDILVMQIDNTTGSQVNDILTMPNPGNDDTLNGIAIDPKGQVYVAGTLDVEGTTLGLVAQVQLSAAGNMIVASYSITAMGTGTGISLDPGSSDVYVVGSGPPGSNAFHAYVEKFNSGLNPHDLGYTSGGGSDIGSGVAFDPNSGIAYIVGTTTSSGLSTDGTTLNGTSDAFLSAFGF